MGTETGVLELVHELRAVLKTQREAKVEPVRDEYLNVRLTVVEDALLKAAAQEAGMNVSDYVRTRLFNGGGG